ncbi:hypothetical protein DFH09DRAFT_1088014 [Mycena vulgaris]|nr:hypothetical protein DFH09DRAFT_1088014 [Mycena vulgaris]
MLVVVCHARKSRAYHVLMPKTAKQRVVIYNLVYDRSATYQCTERCEHLFGTRCTDSEDIMGAAPPQRHPERLGSKKAASRTERMWHGTPLAAAKLAKGTPMAPPGLGRKGMTTPGLLSGRHMPRAANARRELIVLYYYYYDDIGSAVARFEVSTLPQHAGRRVLHIRIVKILQPVACSVAGYEGRVVRPKEDHLLTVRFHGGPPEAWAYDIHTPPKNATPDFRVAAVLRVLWNIV